MNRPASFPPRAGPSGHGAISGSGRGKERCEVTTMQEVQPGRGPGTRPPAGYSQGRTERTGLTERQRDILRMVVVDGLTSAEIGARTGLIKQKVSRTLEQLCKRGELQYMSPGMYRMGTNAHHAPQLREQAGLRARPATGWAGPGGGNEPSR